MDNVIVTWMYSSPAGENILHKQVGSESSDEKVQNYYWRCVFLLFESSYRLNSDAQHILFVNKNPPNTIDGIDTSSLVRQYDIRIVEFPTITKSTIDYYEAWNTQFIVLDILDWLKKNVKQDDNVFILDSDTVFNRPISDDVLRKMKAHKALLYSIDYDDNYSVNGLTCIDLLNISKEMNPHFPANKFTYSGGEFVCCLGSEISKIADMARVGYSLSLERHQSGLKKFNEEAHLLSYVYHLLKYDTHTANQVVKRIWTNRSVFCNIDGSELSMVLWHLPAEKKNGFVNVFRSYRKRNGWYELTKINFLQEYRIEETLSSKMVRLLKQSGRSTRRVLTSVTKR